MFASLKRSRSEVVSEPPEQTPASAPASYANALAPELAAYFPERLGPMFNTWGSLPAALLAVFDELNAMPRVPIPAPTTEREGRIRDLLAMDALLEAVRQARTKTKAAWERTLWEQKRSSNFCVLDRQAEQDDGTVIQDGCAICGVDKTECMNQDEHFGARGESPPDAVCPHCKCNFYNSHDSRYTLLLHLAQKHGEGRLGAHTLGAKAQQ